MRLDINYTLMAELPIKFRFTWYVALRENFKKQSCSKSVALYRIQQLFKRNQHFLNNFDSKNFPTVWHIKWSGIWWGIRPWSCRGCPSASALIFLFTPKNSQKWKYLKKRPVDEGNRDEIRHLSLSWVSWGMSDDCQSFCAHWPPKWRLCVATYERSKIFNPTQKFSPNYFSACKWFLIE